MSVESCRVRQDNELVVLKAVYNTQVHNLRKPDDDEHWYPMDILMILTAQKGMSGPSEPHVEVGLQITCGENYPNEIPVITLNSSKGLSNEKIAELSSILEGVAKSLAGEEMILQLAQNVEEFLHQHDKQLLCMRQEKNRQMESELLEKQHQEDKERQIVQYKIQKRVQALNTERKDRKEMVRKRIEYFHSLTSQSLPSSLEEKGLICPKKHMNICQSLESPHCNHGGVKLLHFNSNRGERKVNRGKCLGHSPKGSVVYAGVDMITGELLAIREWSLKCETTGDSSDTTESTDRQHSMKPIASIEHEMNQLYRLQHANLVRYLSMLYEQNDDTILIYILEEFVVGTTCSSFLSQNIPVAVDILRHIASGVLSALEYLHSNSIIHRNLRDSSIHIDHCGLVKVSDYSVNKRLSDIHQSSCVAKAEQDFLTIQGRGGKKLDIYRFGIIILSLFKGTIISEKELTNEWSTSVPVELWDFLSMCLNDNERARWTAEQLQGHQFIKAPLQRGILPQKLSSDDEQDSEQHEALMEGLYLSSTLNKHSRIETEFQFLKGLGRGAFGDVIKVKNKLDNSIYAIKRIPLNAKNKMLNKKITREVMLLSRLNHENVVRYFNSWIESAFLESAPDRSTSSSNAGTLETLDGGSAATSIDELISENVEVVSPVQEVKWTMAYQSKPELKNSEEEESYSNESDSDDEWDIHVPTSTVTDLSDSIQFVEEDISQMTDVQSSWDVDSASKQSRESTNKGSETGTIREIQFMYIQMEFCEKSTLRTAIDKGLWEDEERAWRLFREIVEGLIHIHQQSMIHRDLKPVNIFLDSNDHVKIGDFGLATIDPRILSDERTVQSTEKSTDTDLYVASSMTGAIGTELYAAPELSAKTAKAIYNQKVDMYSLGIIFFEMFSKPFATAMERAKILSNIRSKDIVLPADFVKMAKPNVVNVLQWLLNHDPSQRPTSQELLSSHYLPPPQLQETQLQEMMRHTLAKSQSKAHNCFIACCFNQMITAADDITYDGESLPSKKLATHFTLKYHLLREYVKTKISKVFEKHGGINVVTPLLTPRSDTLQFNAPDTWVKLMTTAGQIVAIPPNLRTPFARYVVWNQILYMRRYAIERVYQERDLYGYHPIGHYECAFDVISTSVDLMAEAELIYIVWDTIEQFPELKERTFIVRINHSLLLQAVLMSCDIEPEKYPAIYTILYQIRDGKFSKGQVQTSLISLCLPDTTMSILSSFFEAESAVDRIDSVLKSLMKKKKGSEVAALAAEGLKVINAVTSHAIALGVKWTIVITPLLALKTQQYYSGIIYQVSCDVHKKRKRGGHDVIAIGGRYDTLLALFRPVALKAGLIKKDVTQHGVGVSISLGHLVHAVGQMQSTESFETSKLATDIFVAVSCTDGQPKRELEMTTVMKELWSLGFHVIPLNFATTDEVLDYCQENSIIHAVILRFGEIGNLRMQSWERERFQEKKISICAVSEYFQGAKPRNDHSSSPVLNRSESRTFSNDNTPSIPPNVTINFIPLAREKMSGSNRKAWKNTIIAQMTSHLQRISSKVDVEVFAVFLEFSVIKTIASLLEVDQAESNFEESIQLIIEKYSRYRKYIQEICSKMWEFRNDKQRPTLVLYSLSDNRYQFLI